MKRKTSFFLLMACIFTFSIFSLNACSVHYDDDDAYHHRAPPPKAKIKKYKPAPPRPHDNRFVHKADFDGFKVDPKGQFKFDLR